MTTPRDGSGPPPPVLAAYGLQEPPIPLPGGQGSSWRAGKAVLKPLDGDASTVAWEGALLGRLCDRDDLRVSVPLQTTDGCWTAEGWTARRYEPGTHVPGRWHDIIDLGRRLHAALEGEPEPAFLHRRTDRWAVADRVAWGESPVADEDGTRHLTRLLAALRPLHLRRQLVHGDLTGNVLFDGQLPPLVLDLSPYWRPPVFASAVVAADALLFEEASEAVLEPLLQDPDFPQCLLRALIFRAVTDHLTRPGRRHRDPYLRAVQIAVSLTTGS